MPSVFRVRTALEGGSGGPQVSTMFFSDNGTLTAQHAADAVHTWWNAVKIVMAGSYTIFVEPLVTSIDVTTGQPTAGHTVTSTSFAGTSGADPLPWATQAVAQWHSGVYSGGREIRGHTFIPGATEANSAGGVPDASLINAINAASATLVADPLADLVVYSRKKHLSPSATGGSVWGKWGYLSSRRD